MTTQKHTPTPWKVQHDGCIMGPSFFIKIASPWIEEAWTGDAEARANAAFIVQAVNSFDAMKKALEAFADFCDGFDGMHRGLASEDDHDIYAFEGRGGIVRITLGDLRRARAALRLANQECET
jgi:hypothetical protein